MSKDEANSGGLGSLSLKAKLVRDMQVSGSAAKTRGDALIVGSGRHYRGLSCGLILFNSNQIESFIIIEF
jgi:hypothetical protein